MTTQPRIFDHLRLRPWHPRFQWAETPREAADLINRPHEDYPARVYTTKRAIRGFVEPYWDGFPDPRSIHRGMFADQPFAGAYRQVNVWVGDHVAPDWVLVTSYLRDVMEYYQAPTTLGTLVNWYIDFLTLHPFQDGNGRTAGVVLVHYSHKLHPSKGWLAPLQ